MAETAGRGRIAADETTAKEVPIQDEESAGCRHHRHRVERPVERGGGADVVAAEAVIYSLIALLGEAIFHGW